MHYRWLSFDDLSASQLYELLAFRQQVFIVEHASPYQDLDGKDQTCWHLVVRDRPGGDLAACARVRGPYRNEPAFIGRFVVAPAHRGTGLGKRIVAESLQYLSTLHPHEDVTLSAQLHLEKFYAGFGFVPVGDVYDDGGIPHVEMIRRMPRPFFVADDD